jgi:hypothetical protein
MSPRDTFDQYVFPSMKDFEANPAKHRAVSALSYIDALAEDVWNAVGRPGKSAGDYRSSLAKDLIELAYARDVHDIHKHGMLDRKSVVLPNGRRPEVVYIGGALHAVALTLKDGRTVTALDVARKCVNWWERKLTELGWPPS